MNVGIGLISITKVPPDIPMPIGTETVTPSVPKAQRKPRKTGQKKCRQVKSSCSPEDPAESIEQDKDSMKDKEKIIQELIPHAIFIRLQRW
jgi:hypothetical protein